MCKVTSSESNVTTMNELLEGLKAELFTEAREKKLQEIVETIFNEHMSNMRKRIETALSVCEDNGTPVTLSLKFYPDFEYRSMVCLVKDTSPLGEFIEHLKLTEKSSSYFSNELNNLLFYRRFCKQMSQKFVSAGFNNGQMFIVDIHEMMQEYING